MVFYYKREREKTLEFFQTTTEIHFKPSQRGGNALRPFSSPLCTTIIMMNTPSITTTTTSNPNVLFSDDEEEKEELLQWQQGHCLELRWNGGGSQQNTKENRNHVDEVSALIGRLLEAMRAKEHRLANMLDHLLDILSSQAEKHPSMCASPSPSQKLFLGAHPLISAFLCVSIEVTSSSIIRCILSRERRTACVQHWKPLGSNSQLCAAAVLPMRIPSPLWLLVFLSPIASYLLFLLL